MRIIKGYDSKKDMQDFIQQFQSKCESNHIFLNTNIAKPTYEEANEFTAKIVMQNTITLQSVTADVTAWLNTVESNILPFVAKVIYDTFLEIQSGSLAFSIIKNIYARCMVALKYRFASLLTNKRQGQDNRILFIGRPDKYDFIVLTIMGKLGAEVLIVTLGTDQNIELLCNNYFEIVTGRNTEVIDFTSVERKQAGFIGASNIMNSWCNFSMCQSPLDYMNLLNFELTTRKVNDTWRTLHIEAVGVPNESEYPALVNSVNQKAGAMSRKYEIFDRGILNPTYDETQYFDANYAMSTVTPKEILKSFLFFENSGVSVDIEHYINSLIEQKKFETVTKKDNYIKVLYLWLIRYLNLFFKGKHDTNLPLVIIWGGLNAKEEEFVGLLSLLPLDILHLAASQTDMYKVLLSEDIFRICLGGNSTNFKEYPQNNGLSKVATVAYKAERDLDTLLYSGTEGLYRSKQFKDVEPIVLKTTFDEIGILWREPAKLRPSFEAMGNLVKVPTIFAKIDGVLNGDSDTYLSILKGLVTSETLLIQKLPFVTSSNQDTELYDFVKQLCYNNVIDFERLKKSKFYTYGVFSEETQSLIMRKVEQLIALNWCSTDVKNLTYKILEVVFSLPHNIVQFIHGYDFTASIPKLILFSGDTGVCSLEDSILTMFLKLVGFDIIVVAPTGYRLVEQYINPALLNSINLGNFDFNLTNIDIMQASSVINNGKKKKKLLGIFG